MQINILNKVLSILLFIAILSQSLSKMILFSNYIINKESITLKFCENKNKPKMKCNGKCHLKKQLQEQDKKENSSKTDIKEVNESQICQSLNIESFVFSTIDSISPNWHYLDSETSFLPASIFHPPTC